MKHLSELSDAWYEFRMKHDNAFSTARYIRLVAVEIIVFVAIALGIEALSEVGAESENVTWEGNLQTSDGRIVHCLAVGNGVSCDWDHASETGDQ